ncbi:hypothetical protein GIB67_009008 [Kingdonia uniflora]|uniref:Uncharacterized protein n=1 Tax=Kingdonia uniflora TaxID=39325 RepID=A0A7J7LVY2_9MAGN|nr:hypothetical protein GIB67_009008 [Kingdonia uniflora]
MEGKQKATEEKQNKKDEMIRNVNVYRNDDEVDEAGIKISKKRKGPMDALVAPIDVDFFPRAPTSNENKKALENIHGYIADFFYEYNISFNCARSDSYSKMMQAIVQYNDPSSFKPPSYNDLRVKILKKKKEETSNWVDNFNVHWESYGVTIMTNCMYEKRQELREMFHTVEWRNSKWPKHPIGKEIMKKVKSNTFLNNMHTCLNIMAPLVDVIRMVYTVEKLSMAYIYSAIEDCKLKVKTNLGDQNEDDRELWKKMEKILDRRWSGMLQKPLHVVTHYLNPQYYYATLTSSDEMESNTKLKEGLLDCITKIFWMRKMKPNLARSDCKSYQGWKVGKEGCSSLCENNCSRFAKRVFGLTSAASPFKVIWSTFDNRYYLEHDRIKDLAYIQYNKRLKKHYEDRIFGKEIDPIVLKSLDECAEWLVPNVVRNDIVLGTDITYGMLEDTEDGFDDPPLTHSFDGDDYDVDANYDVGDGDDDGIDSGSDKDI